MSALCYDMIVEEIPKYFENPLQKHKLAYAYGIIDKNEYSDKIRECFMEIIPKMQAYKCINKKGYFDSIEKAYDYYYENYTKKLAEGPNKLSRFSRYDYRTLDMSKRYVDMESTSTDCCDQSNETMSFDELYDELILSNIRKKKHDFLEDIHYHFKFNVLYCEPKSRE